MTRSQKNQRNRDFWQKQVIQLVGRKGGDSNEQVSERFGSVRFVDSEVDVCYVLRVL